MKALVIGGTGPTGPHIVNGLLERGFRVTVLHGGHHEVEFAGPVEDIHGDVHFEDTLRASLGDRSFDVAIVTYGRLKMIADVLVGRTERLISVGTSAMAIYEVPRWGPSAHFTADHPAVAAVPDPVKERFFHLIYQAEQAVMQHHQAGHYNAAHFRYPMVYGPRQPATRDWCIVRRILDDRRQLILADDGLQLHSRVYMENAAHALLLAVDKPGVSAGKVYNVADERLLTLGQRVEIIANALNHEFEFISMPYELAKPWHPFTVGRGNWVVDIDRTQSELGYRDIVPAEEAIMKAARWLVENRPERGGELETQLGDPFDYEAEDALIRAFQSAKETVLSVPVKDYKPVHFYRHPTQRNEAWQRPDSAGTMGTMTWRQR